MKNNELNTFISSIMNENLVQAKAILQEELNKKLGSALEAKFDDYASTIFEKWDAKKADKNKDGNVSDWEKASTKWADTGDNTDNDETEDEESDQEEEEDESQDQETDENDEESEEDEEEEQG